MTVDQGPRITVVCENAQKVAVAIVALLTEIIKADPEAAYQLAMARVPCNAALADHPTVQVLGVEGGGYQVGLLGVLNGLVGTDEYGFGCIGVDLDFERRIATGARLLTDEDQLPLPEGRYLPIGPIDHAKLTSFRSEWAAVRDAGHGRAVILTPRVSLLARLGRRLGFSVPAGTVKGGGA